MFSVFVLSAAVWNVVLLNPFILNDAYLFLIMNYLNMLTRALHLLAGTKQRAHLHAQYMLWRFMSN